MTEKRKATGFRRKMKKMAASVLAAVFVIGAAAPAADAAAASQKAYTTTLRIISTTDLHGQLTDINYDSGTKYEGSLAQAATLIKEARKGIQYGGSITVDAGDTIYGYGAEYVMSKNGTQFMYEAMASLGYDAVVLGNHDFDFGYTYIKEQLEATGLDKKCVVSNVYDVETEKPVWNENLLISKKLKTSSGTYKTIKIGIIGETRPDLTTYYNHKGILETEDIIENAEKQVKSLQKQGADVIVAVAHCGMGQEKPNYLAGDVIYALAQVKGIDAIMGGHEHMNFPSDDAKAAKYYEYPLVDKSTGLINGKPVVMIADHGTGIGIADLKLKIQGNSVTVTGAKSKINYVKASTKADSSIVKFSEKYEKQIVDSYNEMLFDMEDSGAVTSYFGMLEDNRAMELANESKIKMGLQYIHSNAGKEYSSYPVVAATSYKRFGAEMPDDYINWSGDVTFGDILKIVPYNHNYTYIFEITGAQLKEWLEWTASAYEMAGNVSDSEDTNIQWYGVNDGSDSIIKTEWLNDWSKFYIFDGIEYEIDTSQPAKYNLAGKVMNSSASRISKLTYNGVPVTDSLKMAMVTEGITSSTPVIGATLKQQRLYRSSIFTSDLLREYILGLTNHDISNESNNRNWSVKLPSGDNYLVRSSALSEEEAKKRDWYVSTYGIKGIYGYYRAAFDNVPKPDQDGPLLVAAPAITVETDQDIPVAVQATDASGLSVCKYIEGNYSANDSVWDHADSVVNGEFTVSRNGTYTVFARDMRGNATVKHITINNINRGILQVPTMAKVTNKSLAITGTGTANATLYISIDGKQYETKVESDGTFNYEIASPKAGAEIEIYTQDNGNRTSAIVTTTVVRSGPNQIEVDTIKNNSRTITGSLNDTSSQIFAIIGQTVYVAKNGGKNYYEKSNRYDAGYSVEEVNFVVNQGQFALSIPVQRKNQQVKIFAVDKIGRVNRGHVLKVKEVAPEMPVLYTSCDAERYVYGYVPDPTGEAYGITVTINDNTYIGTSDENGKFKVKVSRLKENEKVYAAATGMINGNQKTSAKNIRVVNSFKKYESTSATTILLDEMDSDSLTVSGLLLDFQGTAYIKAGGNYYDVEIGADGRFTVVLDSPLKAGQEVAVVKRNTYGNIVECAYITVTLAPPAEPVLLTEEITEDTTTVKVVGYEKCTAIIRVGSKVYRQTECTYSQRYQGYVYKVTIKPSKKNSRVQVYMKNDSGYSKKIVTKVLPSPKAEKENDAEKNLSFRKM